ncbi:MAG TPA: TetR/AcrR family transcriptional regulator [Polyangia bacterium]|nr:TetR/AcrR family transcriptional regulator [Polyangia bacterium]
MRRYASKLREEQAAATRDRILRAFVAELGSGDADFSIQRVADRAGVGVRTVYHHFPTRDVQIDAVADLIESQLVGGEPGPADLADLPAYGERIYRRALEHEAETRASLAPGVAEQVRTRRRKRRLARVDAVLGELGVPAAETRRLAAVVKGMVSADFGFGLMDRYGLSADEAIAAVREGIAGVVGAARRR